MPRTPAALLLSAIILTACGGDPPDTRPGQPVAHRRAAFKEMIKSFEPMGVMVRSNRYDAAKFSSLTSSLMAKRDTPWQYFKPDTLYPPSHATAEVWTRAEEFATRKKEFFDATDKLAAVAGTKDAKEAKAAFEAVEKTCHDCHDTFKTR